MAQARAQADERLAYTPEEVAALMGVSRTTIYRMVENGHIPHKRIRANGKGIRGGILIPAADIQKWLSVPDEPRIARVQREAEKIVASVRNNSRGKRR